MSAPRQTILRRAYTAALTAGLLLFGLSVPLLSSVALAGCVLLVWTFDPLRRGLAFHRPVLGSVLLSGLALTYYGTAFQYGFIPARPAITAAFSIVAAYVVGRRVRLDMERPSLLLVLAPFLGFALYALLSIVGQYGFALNVPRYARAFWDAAQPINGITFGMFAAVGLAVPWGLVLSAGRSGEKIGLSVKAAAGVLLATAAYVNVVFENRTPFLASGAACLAVLATTVVGSPRGARSRWRIASVLTVAAVLVVLVVRNPVVSELAVYQRFRTSGLDTPRYELWGVGVRSVLMHPLGGRQIVLPFSVYLHNLWLDVANDCGLLPAAFLVLFYLDNLVHLRQLVRIRLFGRWESTVLAVIACNFLIDFSTPTIQSSPVYYAANVFALGLLANRSVQLRQPRVLRGSSVSRTLRLTAPVVQAAPEVHSLVG